MFGRSNEVTDAATLAFQKGEEALSLFDQARSGLVEAQALHLGVIDAAKSKIENAKQEISAAEDARTKNERAIAALSTILGE